jgi:protein-L-isoaspartate O-methyltransferase
MGVRCPRWPISRLRRSAFSLAVIAFSGLPLVAQNSRFADKLAPYVVSPQNVVDRMLQMANIKPGEIVYDLGCGDGRVLITAAQVYHAKAVGVEIDERLVKMATENVQRLGLENRIKVVHGDLMKTDFSDADVVVIYLLTMSNAELRPRLEKLLKPGARVLSYSFPVPGWKPERVDTIDDQHGHKIYMYQMPPRK